MDKELYKKICENFLMIFKINDFWDIFILVTFGVITLAFFIILSLLLWILQLLYLPAQAIDDMILNTDHHHFVKCVLLLLPPTWIFLTLKFTLFPVLCLPFWIVLFFFNIFVDVSSNGNSNWVKFKFQ